MKSLSIRISSALLSIFVIMLSASFVSNPEPKTVDTFESIIVAKITDITAKQYDDIEAAVEGIDELNIEYCCMWSGVMVLKLNNSALYEAGDIHVFIKSTLHKASALKKVDILHVHTGLSGVAKC